MELLEGVIAYHHGHLQKSKNALSSAQTRYLQVNWSLPFPSISRPYFVMVHKWKTEHFSLQLELVLVTTFGFYLLNLPGQIPKSN